ncbi:MAG: hypothetical protein KBC67_01480 [Candidatus Pacebacteria bacterium]|nr:hypothetical protein [Candidatus Paceibacterota bacterium]
MPIIKITYPKHLNLGMPSLSVACNKKILQEIVAHKALGTADTSHCNIFYFKAENNIDTVLVEITIDKTRNLQLKTLNTLKSIVVENILCVLGKIPVKQNIKILAQVEFFDPKKGKFGWTTYRPEKK